MDIFEAIQNNNIERVKLLLSHSNIEIDFDIKEFKNNIKLYLLLKNKTNYTNILNKILSEIVLNKVLSEIEG